MIQKIINDIPLISAIAFGVISEIIAVRQILKYPSNDSVGGVLAFIIKLLQPKAAA